MLMYLQYLSLNRSSASSNRGIPDFHRVFPREDRNNKRVMRKRAVSSAMMIAFNDSVHPFHLYFLGMFFLTFIEWAQYNHKKFQRLEI